MPNLQAQFIKHLRSRYAAMILQSEVNKLRMQVQEAAKKEYQETQTEHPITQQ